MTNLVAHLEDYDTGFTCGHGQPFDCDPCMERLSKKQRDDASEIARLRTEVKEAEARGRLTGLEEAAQRVETWIAGKEAANLCAAIRALGKGPDD